jgi:hypothetical protein
MDVILLSEPHGDYRRYWLENLADGVALQEVWTSPTLDDAEVIQTLTDRAARWGYTLHHASEHSALADAWDAMVYNARAGVALEKQLFSIFDEE